MSTTDLPGSSLLANRYRLVERLGAGGMSVVWRGFDEVLGRQVAVKVLPPSTSADPSFRRRLRAEAQAAARLSHPNITNVYDYGEAITVDGEPVPYVVMELVDGESLAAVLARSRRLPWDAAVRIAAEVAAALAAAHARGIVHRDVTPANVMLTPGGAKVVDFGISALIGENDIDPDGSLLGTPAYLAPERLEGGQVSPATDVYAVGLLIYRTLIGQLPWDVGTTTALLRAHQYTEPEPLPPVDGLPSAVATLIARCLQKRPSDRPSCAELAHVLGTVSAGVPASRAFVPDWAEAGEDTTILPSQPYTGGPGRFRPGLPAAAPHDRGRASVPGAAPGALDAAPGALDAGPGAVGAAASGAGAQGRAGDTPLAPASGIPAQHVPALPLSTSPAASLSVPSAAPSSGLASAPSGSSSAPPYGPSSAPAQRAPRNSRFGPMPPSTSAPSSPAAPPMPPPGSFLEPTPGYDDPADPLGDGRPEHSADQHSGGRPDHCADQDRGGRPDRGGRGPALRPAFGDPALAAGLSSRPESATVQPGPVPTRRPGPIAPQRVPPLRRISVVHRRRILAVAGAVLGAGVLAWAFGNFTSEPPKDGVLSNAIAPQPPGNKCVVSYAVWSDDGDRFKAAVTIANRDVRAVANWKLWFLMPGDQVVSGNGKLQLDQQARQVTVNSNTTLSPQASTTMQFTGRYDLSNAAPMVFELDGQACDTYVSPKPGDPSRPVEHLSNGTVRLGPVPSKDTPIPGISIAPGGVVVPVPVTTDDPVTGTTPTNGRPTTTTVPVTVPNGPDESPDPSDDTSSSASTGTSIDPSPPPKSSEPVTGTDESESPSPPPSFDTDDSDSGDTDDEDTDGAPAVPPPGGTG